MDKIDVPRCHVANTRWRPFAPPPTGSSPPRSLQEPDFIGKAPPRLAADIQAAANAGLVVLVDIGAVIIGTVGPSG